MNVGLGILKSQNMWTTTQIQGCLYQELETIPLITQTVVAGAVGVVVD